jgi:hypothetical protein
MIQYLEADRDIEVLVKDTDNEKVGEPSYNFPVVVVDGKAVEKKFKKAEKEGDRC